METKNGTAVDGPPRREREKSFSGSVDNLSVDVDSYFTGPIDSTKASKLPYFLRLRGSVLPGMILPMLFVAAWTTGITLIHQLVHEIDISAQLLTVLGFLVGLALSFRSSTAYERYNDGRKCWSLLTLHSRNLARLFWVHGREREGEAGVEDLLGKLTAINLLLAFSVSLKHKLRHEPEYDYPDLENLISNLKSFAKEVHEDGDLPKRKKVTTPQVISNYLGITFMQSHPTRRYKAYQKAGKHNGNLPLEIMTYLSAYLDTVIQAGTLPTPAVQSVAVTYLGGMMDALTNCERISQTPLPIAYNIVISQITWLYVILLPFQLVKTLSWIVIPGVLVAAYIILGMAAIGREIEDPFGSDVNDLNLDRYCDSLAIELDMITSVPYPKKEEWITVSNNHVLFPNVAQGGFPDWKARGVDSIRRELRRKPYRHLPPSAAKEARDRQLRQRQAEKDKKQHEQDERDEAEAKASAPPKEQRDAIMPADVV